MKPTHVLGLLGALALASAILAHQTGTGDARALAAGAGLMGGSFWLLDRTAAFGLGQVRRPRLALALFASKLLLLLGFAGLGLKTVVRAPMSFCFGVTLLPLAIVLAATRDAFSRKRSKSGGGEHP